MLAKFFSKGRKILTSPQTSILSAAIVIMLMIGISRVFGLIRYRTLAHFFIEEEVSVFLAAFRLPDLVFEVFIFGALSSAFIPVFTKSYKQSSKKAWVIAGTITNIGLLIFFGFAFLGILLAGPIYNLFVPGFSSFERNQVIQMGRILFLAQGFFVTSYILTGVLESLQHFLIPALAPLFYNLGIILLTIILAPSLGILAPTLGAVLGAFLHFAIQLPFAYKLGFRFVAGVQLTQDVKRIIKLALPRVVEIGFSQITKVAELFFASLISTGSYTYFTFANSLQLLPVGLFGTSIAKAALPTLSRESDSKDKFRKTLLSAIYQVIFLILPLATFLIVLRIPVVRLAFGAKNFSWEATWQTGLVLTAFAIGVPFQAMLALLVRGFWALHDTKTPVAVSLLSVFLIVAGDLVLIKGFSLPVWALAISFSIAVFVQTMVLFYLLLKRIDKIGLFQALIPLSKSLIASVVSGSVMFFLLKFFDRSVWVKRLSFLIHLEGIRDLPFEKFVLDTRYTFNLLVLTIVVSLIGGVIYLLVSFVLRSKELAYLYKFIRRRQVTPPPKETELPIAPPVDQVRS